MEKRSNILFFTSFPPPVTGQTVGTQLFYQGLSEHFDTERINNVDKNRFERDSGAFSLRVLFFMLGKTLELAKALLGKRYEFVYLVYSSTKIGMLRDFLNTGVIRLFSKAKIVAHIHSGDYGHHFKSPLLQWCFRRLLARTYRFCFQSRLQNHIDHLLDPKQPVYFPNMISPEIFFPNEEVEAKIEGKAGREAFHVMYISNMIKEKGYEDLVKACIEVIRGQGGRGPRLHVHLAGGWPKAEDRTALEALLAQEGVQDQFTIYGSVKEREAVRALLAQADVFALPTYYRIEAQPFSIIEALNAGTPVISTKHATIPEMVMDGQSGFLVGKQSPAEIAEKLRLLLDYPYWAQTARMARQNYLERFSSKVVLGKMMDIFFLRT